MSLQKNILASFASQIYVTLIGIVLLPLYVQYMGAEAYGLVGFFAMLQAWFNLLDIGLTPTIARETARQRAGATDALAYRRLVRALEGIFLAVALLGGAALIAASPYIAADWLQASQLPLAEVRASLQLMALVVAMRWLSGLYRGAIGGAERLVWLGAFNAGIATLRFGGVLPLLVFVGATPTLFFTYQIVIALAELGGLVLYAYRLFPPIPAGSRVRWAWSPLKPVLRFSLAVAFTSSVWVFVTQTDKLVLSRILPLAEYGYFTLAVLVASGIMIISGPISNALMPRMAMLEAEGEHASMIEVYRQATQVVAIVAGAAAVTVASSAESLLWVWTGNRTLAEEAAPVLVLYAIGNGILAVSAFPYYLQYAKGDLRLHLLGNAAFVVLLVPAVTWAAGRYGGTGAGWVWLGMNLLLFLGWLPLVHRRFEPGLNLKWYTQDILVIFAAAGVAACAVGELLPRGGSRPQQLAQIAFAGAAVLLASAAASSAARARLRSWRLR
jgi:O-antigen/teichoic acid export membrane protein